MSDSIPAKPNTRPSPREEVAALKLMTTDRAAWMALGASVEVWAAHHRGAANEVAEHYDGWHDVKARELRAECEVFIAANIDEYRAARERALAAIERVAA